MRNLTRNLIPQNKKSLAVLIDPDKILDVSQIDELVQLSNKAKVDALFIGGSLVASDNIDSLVSRVKELFQGPVVLFPGAENQISGHADGILFLNLISGRNPEFLIGKQVLGAPIIRKLGLEVYPTAYMLIGESSSASYMSNTKPIPHDNIDIALATAIAGEMMGNHLLFLDAGSGAKMPVSAEMIAAVRDSVDAPLMVGGGIKNFDQAYSALESGADMIVIGNVLEKEPHLVQEIVGAVHGMNALNIHK